MRTKVLLNSVICRIRQICLLWVVLVTTLGLRFDTNAHPALLLQYAQADIDAQVNWAALISTNPSLALAQLTASQQRHWLEIAAQHHYAPAQLQLAELANNPHDRLRWLAKAAHMGSSSAQLELYHHFKDSNHQLAIEWLEQSASNDPSNALFRAELAWNANQVAVAKTWLIQAHQLANPMAKKFLDALDYTEHYAAPVDKCYQPLIAVTSTLVGLVKAVQFQKQLSSDKRLQDIGICFSDFVVLPEKVLDCGAHRQNNGRVACDNYMLAQRLAAHEFSHIVVFAQAGKANVVNGIMHLDHEDDYAVFVHELAHFSGFVDEYPLSKTLAQQFCQQDGEYPNLVVGRSLKTIDSVLNNHTLVAARTCDNVDGQAFKRVQNFTFMEFYDEGEIPLDYVQRWRQQILKVERISPAFINLAQAAERVKDKPLADYWWQRLAQFRSQ